MSKYSVKKIENKDSWESFVLSRNPRSFLQSWNWGETNQLMGDKIFRLGFYKGGELVGVCLAVKKKAKRGPYLTISGGPFLDWQDKGLVSFFLKTIERIGKNENVWFVRVRPEMLDSKESISIFRKMGFIYAPMHLHAENTWVLDIAPSEQEILSGMRKNTRYSVRRSLKAGLRVRVSRNSEDVKILKKLQDETVKRHGFVGFSDRLFKYQMDTFGKDNQAKLYLCKKGGEVLVSAIIIFYGDYAYYHHSASSESSREIPASYFLQWKVLCDAKKMGKKFYNFWGIAPKDAKKHRFSGVTVFKTGFGGKRVDWLHAQDLPINRKYWLTYFFETGRRIFRGL